MPWTAHLIHSFMPLFVNFSHSVLCSLFYLFMTLRFIYSFVYFLSTFYITAIVPGSKIIKVHPLCHQFNLLTPLYLIAGHKPQWPLQFGAEKWAQPFFYLYSETLCCLKLSHGSPLQDKAKHPGKLQVSPLHCMPSAMSDYLGSLHLPCSPKPLHMLFPWPETSATTLSSWKALPHPFRLSFIISSPFPCLHARKS